MPETAIDTPGHDDASAPATYRVSVVLATYNRLDLLGRVLAFLATQTLDAREFEVIVVDDGSAIDVTSKVDPGQYPFALTVVRQDNAGPAAARHRGILLARGEILVMIDDDMELPPRFLEEHMALHRSGKRTAVIGRYISDPAIGSKPIFERYHGLKWDQTTQAVNDGVLQVDGTFLATGNTSMRRDDYLRVGGFDLSLPRAEDMALGLDLEESGVELVYSDAAGSVHLSDHTVPEKWMARAYIHGRLEPSIATKHPNMPHADPWRFGFALPVVGRVLCLPSIFTPRLAYGLARVIYKAAETADRLGYERAALRATGLVFGMEYFRGMREDAGSARKMIAGCAAFLRKAAASRTPVRGVPPWLANAVASRGKRPAAGPFGLIP